MKRPFRQVLDLFNEHNQKNLDLFKYVFEKSDSITLWTIGLSIGAISIIANDIGKVKAAIPVSLLSPIVYLLAISVAAGILYRISCLYFFVVNNLVARNLEIAFSEMESMDTKSFLTGNESYERLLKIVKAGFGDDFDALLPVYQNANEVDKKIKYESLVAYYLNNVAWARKDMENAMDFAMETYASYAGISKEEYLEKVRKYDIGKRYRTTTRIMVCLYICYLLPFIAALVLFAVSV